MPTTRIAELPRRKQRFTTEYCIDLNATQAAIRAGYSAATAGQAGHRLLKDPVIAAAVAERLAELDGRARAVAEKNVERQESRALITVADVIDFSGEKPRLRPKSEILERARVAIASVRAKSRRDQRMMELLGTS
jgi:phage terminase small subunit